ncbi:MAG: metal-dependent hydrolase [Candidatus Aenigmarchaeota archaeon]|nr:metal-dependent hydrolase [Candidatus Aenigmarchaeota archaeon]MCX8190930.1 metal-dependent hydrolase [Candidatus Aenigmarchaeota archaeon]MDW8160123.1 metal-dependent hydrolase [Candidatus Aenigmarchaeota archaeon]
MRFVLERLRKEISEKRYLDTVIHSFISIVLCIIFTKLLNVPLEKVLILVFVGSFIPDIDHLLLYKKSKFRSFKNFIRWIIKSDRYRVGFELFHNLPVILLIILFLPYLYLKTKFSFIFFTAFLLHLITDLVLDRIVVKNIRWWRFGI